MDGMEEHKRDKKDVMEEAPPSDGKPPARLPELMKNIFGYFAIWLALFVVVSFSTTEMDYSHCYIVSLLWAWPVWSILVKG
jgi:hypothetical protein